jgi:uncharacterized repeat protein (TIGR01451 family)
MTRLFLAGASATGLIALAAAQAPVAPTKVSPAPPGTIAQPSWHQSPAAKGQSGPAIAGPTPATTPVKPNPIQPVGATDPLPPPVLPTPSVSSPDLPAVPTLAPPTPDIPAPTMTAPKAPPSVSVETTPAPATSAGEPRPLTIAGPGSVASPVSPPTSMSGPVPVGNLPNKHAPGVVVETVSPESVSVGQDVTYELVVRNEGSATVWNVRVEDDVPAGAKYVSSDPVADTANGKLSWSLGSLEAGATKKVKVVVRPTDEGELRNRTVVSFSAATENKMKVTRPRVGVAVSAPDTVKAGDDVAFTVKLQNTGTGPATNLVMRATLSDGLHNPNGAVLELKLPTLAAGQTKTVPLRAVATKAGPQACTLAVVADGTVAEPAKAGFTVVEPKLAARVVGPAKCFVRGEPTYTLEFTNPGTATTDPLTATVPLPAGFEFVQASDGGVPSGTGQEIVWRLPGLPAGAGKAVSLKLKAVAPSDAKVSVRVAAASETEAPQSGVRPVAMAVRSLETKADLAIRSEGVAALRFEVIDVEDPVETGKEAIYEIRLTNQGTGPCTNVNITGFPAEGTSPVAANGPTQVRVTAGQLLFDPIAKLDVKGEAIYRVRVRGTQPGDMKFKVQVSCDQIKSPITKEENTRFTKD